MFQRVQVKRFAQVNPGEIVQMPVNRNSKTEPVLFLTAFFQVADDDQPISAMVSLENWVVWETNRTNSNTSTACIGRAIFKLDLASRKFKDAQPGDVLFVQGKPYLAVTMSQEDSYLRYLDLETYKVLPGSPGSTDVIYSQVGWFVPGEPDPIQMIPCADQLR